MFTDFEVASTIVKTKFSIFLKNKQKPIQLQFMQPPAPPPKKKKSFF